MPTPKKFEAVKEFESNLKKTKSLILLVYQGLKTLQIEQLKKELAQSGAKMVVAKNTLMNIAFKKEKIEIPQEILQGPTAVILNPEEGLESLKSLVKFAKSLGPDLLHIKAGWFENKVLAGEEMAVLASLPDRKQLLAKLLGVLKSPLQKLVSDLKSGQMKLVIVLNQISKAR